MRGARRVFVSIQRTRNALQQLLLERIAEALREHALIPISVNNSMKHYDPLPELRETLPVCNGALIIAFERFRTSGFEYPDDESNEISHTNRRSATVWNQIEAAMAYQVGIPLLMLQEDSLSQEGIIDRHLASIKVIPFQTQECIEALPATIRTALDEWAQAVMR